MVYDNDATEDVIAGNRVLERFSTENFVQLIKEKLDRSKAEQQTFLTNVLSYMTPDCFTSSVREKLAGFKDEERQEILSVLLLDMTHVCFMSAVRDKFRALADEPWGMETFAQIEQELYHYTRSVASTSRLSTAAPQNQQPEQTSSVKPSIEHSQSHLATPSDDLAHAIDFLQGQSMERAASSGGDDAPNNRHSRPATPLHVLEDDIMPVDDQDDDYNLPIPPDDPNDSSYQNSEAQPDVDDKIEDLPMITVKKRMDSPRTPHTFTTRIELDLTGDDEDELLQQEPTSAATEHATSMEELMNNAGSVAIDSSRSLQDILTSATAQIRSMEQKVLLLQLLRRLFSPQQDLTTTIHMAAQRPKRNAIQPDLQQRLDRVGLSCLIRIVGDPRRTLDIVKPGRKKKTTPSKSFVAYHHYLDLLALHDASTRCKRAGKELAAFIADCRRRVLPAGVARSGKDNFTAVVLFLTRPGQIMLSSEDYKGAQERLFRLLRTGRTLHYIQESLDIGAVLLLSGDERKLTKLPSPKTVYSALRSITAFQGLRRLYAPLPALLTRSDLPQTWRFDPTTDSITSWLSKGVPAALRDETRDRTTSVVPPDILDIPMTDPTPSRSVRAIAGPSSRPRPPATATAMMYDVDTRARPASILHDNMMAASPDSTQVTGKGKGRAV